MDRTRVRTGRRGMSRMGGWLRLHSDGARGGANHQGRTMKYMLLMMAPTGGWAKFGTLPPEDIRAHISFMKKLNADLTSAGELVDAQGLAFPNQAKIVTAKAGGGPAVSDGPFPESKEFLAGYWIIDVESPERAYAIAAKASTCPGPGGKPLNMPIEVREVMSGPPVDAP